MRRIFYCLALVAVAHVNLAAQSKPARPAGHCPAVTIEHPDDMVWPGTPVTLTAKVSGGGRGAPPTFFWTVSSGEVINGQGTSTLTIDTTSMSFSDITVTVEVGGLAEECDRAASCAVHIGGCGLIRKFDEFADLDFEDEKPRLDNFA